MAKSQLLFFNSWLDASFIFFILSWKIVKPFYLFFETNIVTFGVFTVKRLMNLNYKAFRALRDYLLFHLWTCFRCKHWKTKKKNFRGFYKKNSFPGVTWCPTQNLGPIGWAVLMFIGYKQTNKILKIHDFFYKIREFFFFF